MNYRKVPLADVKVGDVIAHHDETGRYGDPVWNKVTVAPAVPDGRAGGKELELRYQPVEPDATGLYGPADGSTSGPDAYAMYPRDAEVLIKE